MTIATECGPWCIAFYVVVNLAGLAIIVLLAWAGVRWFNRRWKIERARKKPRGEDHPN